MGANKKWTEDDEKWLYKNYATSRPSELETRLGRNNHAIAEYARKRGLTKDEGFLRSPPKGDLSVLLNESLDTYYWIGLLLADGCFQKTNQLTISLSKNDEEQMLRFARYLKTGVRYIKRDGQVVLAVQDRHIVPKIMEKYGIPYNKTYGCVKLPKISKRKFVSLLCGFIDGDGSRCASGFRLENYKTWEPFYRLIEDYLKTTICVNYTPTKNTVTGYIRKDTALYLIEFQKKNCLPTMERKWYEAPVSR
jgi:hypothetical protein